MFAKKAKTVEKVFGECYNRINDQIDMGEIMKREDIRIRDPYIVAADGIYYMYSSTGSKDGTTVVVYKSEDLDSWSEPVDVYKLDTSTWKSKELWAPEVHYYMGRYYMFLSILGKNGLRGTEISVSDTPDGIFLPITDHPATPEDKSCIDGTLFVDGDTPYIVYSRDWPDNYVAERDVYVGQICATQLTRDLKERVGDPFVLFESSEVPYSAAAPAHTKYRGEWLYRYGSDAPFINRLRDGRIFLTWSPIPNNNYVVLGAVSENIRGPWTHIDVPLFDENGGHAMFFNGFDGQRKMCMHQPERYPLERAVIFDVIETSDGLRIKNSI